MIMRKEDRSTRASLEWGETKSSSGVVELCIVRLRMSWGLDASGCRLLRRRGVVPRWRQGSYATRSEMQNTIRERGDRGVLIHYESKSLANVNHWINGSFFGGGHPDFIDFVDHFY